jgi:hypothetical protein
MECPELDTRGNIFANGYLLCELGINNEVSTHRPSNDKENKDVTIWEKLEKCRI